jgi:uncharacterized membrane protein YecN with MAPEG domain
MLPYSPVPRAAAPKTMINNPYGMLISKLKTKAITAYSLATDKTPIFLILILFISLPQSDKLIIIFITPAQYPKPGGGGGV